MPVAFLGDFALMRLFNVLVLLVILLRGIMIWGLLVTTKLIVLVSWLFKLFVKVILATEDELLGLIINWGY